MSIIIGLTSSVEKDPPRYFIYEPYVTALRKTGVSSIIIPPGEPKIETIYNLIDGIVFTGGGDINPKHYQGNIDHNALYGVDDLRDESEFAMLEYALKHEKPILAVCRGMQLINIHFGGNLMEHIPDNVQSEILHRNTEKKFAYHPVRLNENNRLLPKKYGETVQTASWHHQAVDKLGHSIIPTAFSEDGLVEAFELKNHRDCLAVQWHPEIMADEDPFHLQIFQDFVERVKKYKNSTP